MFGFNDTKTDVLKNLWANARQSGNAVTAIRTFQINAHDAGYSQTEVNDFLKKHLTLR